MTDKTESLERLAKLADEGRITESEYATLKAELLGGQGPVKGRLITDDPEQPRQDKQVAETTSPKKHVESRPETDMYEQVMVRGVHPRRPGWYPDPEALGTHSRWFDGNQWSETLRSKRVSPGWYEDPVHGTDYERWHDGLNFSGQYRRTGTSQVLIDPFPSKPLTDVSRPRDWRLWVGLGLSVLGILAVAAAFAVTSDDPDPDLGRFIFNVITNPLTWVGLVGAFLLTGWKQSTD